MRKIKSIPMLTRIIVLCIFLVVEIQAQGVKISPQPGTPDPSAILETQDSTRGVLMPRVNLQSSTDAVTIANPATSLMVFNTGATLAPAGFYYNAGTPQAPQWALVLPNPANTALNMNGFAIENLATPVNPADAVTKDYVDNQIINVSGSGGSSCLCPSMMSDESAGQYTYVQALDYCRGLNQGGFSDWRLPDMREVARMRGDGSVAISNLTSGNNLWATADVSSSTVTHVSFNLNNLGQSTGGGWNLYFVRCIR
jgi:hypothetical protein